MICIEDIRDIALFKIVQVIQSQTLAKVGHRICTFACKAELANAS